jgi:hypothetical protein
MIGLTKTMIRKGYKLFNMFFHSTALKAGLSSFVKTVEDEERFLRTIEEYLVFARGAGIGSAKLSEAAAYAFENGQPVPSANAAHCRRLRKGLEQ